MSENFSLKTCPRCSSPAASLKSVEAGMKLALQQAKSTEDLPGEICENCYNELSGMVSQGVRLRLEKQAREKNRHMLWKSRVGLVKHARQLMQQKAYPEAAVSYEKYLRVLEVAYDLKPGELNPEVFGKSSRSKELTVIASTYWDLLRIYDTNPAYRERMAVAAKKLSEFCPYSPIYPDIVRKAQVFLGSSKNPDLIKGFLKSSKVRVSKCFVATAAYGSEYASVVCDLRLFRDHTLSSSTLGCALIRFYYFVGPIFAGLLERFPQLKSPVRKVLKFFVFMISS